MSELLSRIKIASPCHARWEDMTGDERSRFCGQCEKHVYNFSAMTTAEAEDLIRAKEGKLCGRFYQRKDGTMLTANCPVGLKGVYSRLKLVTAAALTLFFAGFGTLARHRSSPNSGPFAQEYNEFVWTLKGWLGAAPRPMPRPMAMGMVISTPPPMNPGPTANSGTGTGAQP